MDKLRRLLTLAGPNVILIDELLHYVDKAASERVGDSNLATQTLAFVREYGSGACSFARAASQFSSDTLARCARPGMLPVSLAGATRWRWSGQH